MGLAYPLKYGVLSVPKPNSNFRMQDEAELKEWHKEVLRLLRHTPEGPYALVQKIFGPVVTQSLVQQGQFPNHPTASRSATSRSVSNSSLSSSATSSSSRTSTKRTITDDDDDDEDNSSWLTDNPEAGEFCRPRQRRRKN